MQTNKSFMKMGAAVAALTLAGAAGYAAHGAAADGAVNKTQAAVTGTAPASFADIVERVAPAVVSVEVEGKASPSKAGGFGGGEDGEGAQGLPPELRRFFQQQQPSTPQPMRGAGSGFFISADGYLVTNNHVVEGADKITVHTTDDKTYTAKVVGRDPATDLAVIKVDGQNFPYVSFQDRAKPRVGDWVVAVGNPFNLGGSATAGIVSALGRKNLQESSYVDYMQIDAPINRGNSGGPTFDLSGRVVGVNTMIFSPTGGSVGIGFDIPADVVVSKQLISTGKVTRGFIGALVQDVTPEIAESLGLSGKGALVAEVNEGGPAATAGLRPGDVVLKVNGAPISTGSDLTRAVGLAKAGDPIKVEIRREGQTREIIVRSGIRPSEETIASNGRTPPKPGAGDADEGPALAALGLRVAPDPKGQGVRIAGINQSSDAAQKGLRTGDIVLRVGDHATNSAADLKSAVAEAKKAGKKSVLLFVARGEQHTFIPVEIGEG